MRGIEFGAAGLVLLFGAGLLFGYIAAERTACLSRQVAGQSLSSGRKKIATLMTKPMFQRIERSRGRLPT